MSSCPHSAAQPHLNCINQMPIKHSKLIKSIRTVFPGHYRHLGALTSPPPNAIIPACHAGTQNGETWAELLIADQPPTDSDGSFDVGGARVVLQQLQQRLCAEALAAGEAAVGRRGRRHPPLAEISRLPLRGALERHCGQLLPQVL